MREDITENQRRLIGRNVAEGICVSPKNTAHCQPELMPDTTIYYTIICANVAILLQSKNRRPP
jgi:hypothetical protein